MRTEISEFSYGFVLVHELVSHGTHTGAPVFPSTIAEKHKGYDVSIPFAGAPLFLQFKVSDVMVRRNAVGATLLGVPHLRMHLRPRKLFGQHQLLVDLEMRGDLVFYVAPRFTTQWELNLHYTNGDVVAHSAFIEPMAIGPIHDDDHHFVSYAAAGRHGYLFSEPSETKVLTGDQLEVDLVRRGRAASRETSLRALAGELVDIYAERVPRNARHIDTLRRELDERRPAEYLTWLARTLYAAEVLLIEQHAG